MLLTMLRAITSQEVCPQMPSHPPLQVFSYCSQWTAGFFLDSSLGGKERERRVVSLKGGLHGYHVTACIMTVASLLCQASGEGRFKETDELAKVPQLISSRAMCFGSSVQY